MKQHKLNHIKLYRAEGHSGCLPPTATVRSAKDADAVLLAWSRTAPKDGSYHKCDVILSWDDGRTHKHRFELVHSSLGNPSIERDVTWMLEYTAGLRRPDYCSAEQWERVMPADPKDAAYAKHLLRHYAFA